MSPGLYAIAEQDKSPIPESAEILSTEDDTNSNTEQKKGTQNGIIPVIPRKNIYEMDRSDDP